MDNKPTTAEIVIVASGAGALLFSFFDWIEDGGNPWDAGALSTHTWLGLIGAIMAVVIVLEVFAGVKLPDNILGLNWPQIHLSLSFYTALLAIGFLLTDKFGASMGFGFFLSFLAAAGLVTGSILLGKERPGGVRVAPVAGPGPAAPPPPPPPPPA